MNKEYKDKFPSWCSNNKNTYDLVLSDDSDGLLVSNFLEYQNWDSTTYFYDFKMLYKKANYETDNSIIGCDIDFADKDARCWGNHVTALQKEEINPNSANLNNTEKITRNNYRTKYAGSTIAIVLSYYDYDVSNLSEQARMLIMCIDSHYYGFYNGFHDTQRKWLVDVLEYPELYDIILKYKEQDFIDLARSLKIKIPRQGKKDRDGKIWINEGGYLETEIDLQGISDILGKKIALPNCKFEPFFDENQIKLVSLYADTSKLFKRSQIQQNIFSYAQTFKNTSSLTYIEKIK